MLSFVSFLLFSLVSFFASTLSSELRFRSDGTFKILQVADLHYESATKSCADIDPKQYPNCVEANSTSFIRQVIEMERPDLVVYTGDNIDWATPEAKQGLLEAFAPCEDTMTPFAAVLGNHDGQSTLTRKEVVEYLADHSNFPHSLTRLGPSSIHGYSNYFLSIESSSSNSKPSFDLYFLDSGDLSSTPGVSSYDWIHLSQLEWLKRIVESSNSYRPSFAFFHIPLLEYKTLIDEKLPIIGSNLDVFHIPNINSGAFSAFLDLGIKGVFVGHDHLNDYCGDYYGIQLCYGGVVGLDAYSKVGWPRRVRVIQLEGEGKGAVTWKTLDDGKMSMVDYQTLF